MEWYESVLGFKAQPFFEPPYVFAILTLGGTRLMLRRVDGYERPANSSGWDAYLTLVGGRIREVYDDLVAKNVEIARPLQRMPYDDCEFDIRDPDGNLLCISELLEDTSGIPELGERVEYEPFGLASDEKFDAVIFDLYGTLVDFSFSAYRQSLTDMREALGASDSFDDAFHGLWSQMELGELSVEEAIGRACDRPAAEISPAEMGRALVIWREAIWQSLEPRAGVIDFLKRLREAGCVIGLISNTGETVAELWDRSAFAPYIPEPVFSCRAGLRKPDWRIYALACDLLNVPASETLFVGDGTSGELQGAEEAGMTAVQVRIDGEDEESVAYLNRAEWDGPVVRSLNAIASYLIP
jgi:putative hydrolase of the HAD superfamily